MVQFMCVPTAHTPAWYGIGTTIRVELLSKVRTTTHGPRFSRYGVVRVCKKLSWYGLYGKKGVLELYLHIVTKVRESFLSFDLKLARREMLARS